MSEDAHMDVYVLELIYDSMVQSVTGLDLLQQCKKSEMQTC